MYQKLYEDGIVIVEDFFDDYTKVNANEPMYPQPLFSCSKAQANYVTKTSVSRELIFDGVVRSQTTCGYDSYIVNSKSVSGSKKTKVTGPCPRQQLKHNLVNQPYPYHVMLRLLIACMDS